MDYVMEANSGELRQYLTHHTVVKDEYIDKYCSAVSKGLARSFIWVFDGLYCAGALVWIDPEDGLFNKRANRFVIEDIWVNLGLDIETGFQTLMPVILRAVGKDIDCICASERPEFAKLMKSYGFTELVPDSQKGEYCLYSYKE